MFILKSSNKIRGVLRLLACAPKSAGQSSPAPKIVQVYFGTYFLILILVGQEVPIHHQIQRAGARPTFCLLTQVEACSMFAILPAIRSHSKSDNSLAIHSGRGGDRAKRVDISPSVLSMPDVPDDPGVWLGTRNLHRDLATVRPGLMPKSVASQIVNKPPPIRNYGGIRPAAPALQAPKCSNGLAETLSAVNRALSGIILVHFHVINICCGSPV